MSEQQVPATTAPQPVEAAPADANLVPLTELAPAITAASVSRRTFLGFGLAVAGGVVGAAAIGTLFPVFAEDASGASPIIPNYDPASKQWVYVVDTAACIGCGLCVAACKEENNVPEEPEYTRTWIERHMITTDGELYVDSPDGGIDGFPPESTAPGAAGKAVESAFFDAPPVHAVRQLPVHRGVPGRRHVQDGGRRDPRGRPPVHRLRLLRRRLPVRRPVPRPRRASSHPTAPPASPTSAPGATTASAAARSPRASRSVRSGARKFGEANDPGARSPRSSRSSSPRRYRPEYGTEPRVLYLGPVVEEA